uniref:Cytochrome b5 heme-binding domain-containing protein n=1 Tax=Timema tahoe TaxID=61484 RepID=A0A7R9FE15_9NEOP|nr:unnamed protein product [Timema tahoe]
MKDEGIGREGVTPPSPIRRRLDVVLRISLEDGLTLIKMIEALKQADEPAVVITTTAATEVGRKTSLLSLAGDALCMAVTALRLSEAPSPPPVAESTDKIVTLDQVAWHDNSTDCWVVLYDRVYDITNFLYQHPGGEEILLEYAGRDATFAFRGIGHSAAMLKALDPHLVGILPKYERIYSCPGGKLAGL